jgi:cob(I)alamin adenosyltransferase
MLYTRKGDNGTTTTCNTGGGRIPKSSLLIEALGNVDELNAWLGLCRSKSKEDDLKSVLEEVQQNLFIVQAEIAGADKVISDLKVSKLEEVIDGVEKRVPARNTFLASGATELAACLGVARTLARRAERRVVDAVDSGELKVSGSTGAYLNRLSSLLYALERLVVARVGAEEKPPSYK